MNRIEQQRTDYKVGDLINPHNGHALSAAEVAAYNRYTMDLNRERHQDRREFLLHQRFVFFIGCGYERERVA
jgi:hypothetical protein